VVYLDEGFTAARKEGRLRSMSDLMDTVIESATLRVRPLVMTVGMNIVGLVPVMLDRGIGSDVAKRIAAPLWGGLLSLTILTLLVIPAACPSRPCSPRPRPASPAPDGGPGHL
jgi:Cu(I)/Ag(I) efflux system membrane protein CusA/SilA